MRLLALFLLIFGGFVQTSDAIFEGDWSMPVDGLCGRMLLFEDAPFNGTRLVAVYLELRNVSSLLDPLLVDYRPPQFDVVDTAGNSMPHPLADASFFTVDPYTLVLPCDSTLRFRVSVNGYGIGKNKGIALQLEKGLWIISADTHAERFLTGSFVVPQWAPTDLEDQRKDLARGHRLWRGTLILPKLRIPLPDSK